MPIKQSARNNERRHPASPEENQPLWPTFRHDLKNSGRSLIAGKYSGDHAWSFQTGKGIFSTPVIDADGIIYIGSADHYFYSLHPSGNLLWKYKSGEIIDSAAALSPFNPERGFGCVTFISGDGHMYHLRTDEGIADPEQRVLWKFEAELRQGISYNRWFEGNVSIGPDGSFYAGNTNFKYYAIHPDGTLKWTYDTRANNWSQTAFGEDGSIYWGSLDTFVRAVNPQGEEIWKRRTLGFVAASAAVGSDGTIYIGSFDSNFYALEPRKGKLKWKFSTGDHIYSSAALGTDDQGNTQAIYFGSADGLVYALSLRGELLWQYDAGDPIRSSPVIGLSIEGQEILYFGAGNGKLYALNAENGSFRWAFDTTPQEAELRDRNDLNGSPALGKNGIYIGGEHGQVWYVPYDYPMHSDDPRGQLKDPAQKSEGATLKYVTPGGSVLSAFPEYLLRATHVTLRLEVMRNGKTQDARVCNLPRLLPDFLGCRKDNLKVSIQPETPIQVEHSADGKCIYIRPEGFLDPKEHYQLVISGSYFQGGFRFGNLRLGGRKRGEFSQEFKFGIEPSSIVSPFVIEQDKTWAVEWTRLALPLPAMLPSLNQIGFDYIDWIIGLVDNYPGDEKEASKLILWAIGAKRNLADELVADPRSDFTLAMNGCYFENAFIFKNLNFNMQVTGIPIPFNLFELRGSFNQYRIVEPGATVWAETRVLSIPTFGAYLVLAGLASNIYEKLQVAGTYITRSYDGPACHNPQGISVQRLEFKQPTSNDTGSVTATFQLESGSIYLSADHRAGIILVDSQKKEALYLDYHHNLISETDSQGNLASVELVLPAKTQLPDIIEAIIVLDVFPFYRQIIE